MSDEQAAQQFGVQAPEVAPSPHHPDAFVVAVLVFATLALAAGLIASYLGKRDHYDD